MDLQVRVSQCGGMSKKICRVERLPGSKPPLPVRHVAAFAISLAPSVTSAASALTQVLIRRHVWRNDTYLAHFVCSAVHCNPARGVFFNASQCSMLHTSGLHWHAHKPCLHEPRQAAPP